MKLKMVIVDFEISTAAKKRLIRYGIPFAVLLGGGALAWAGNPWALPQPSFPQNGPLTASDLNNNFNALADAGAALQAQVAGLGIPSGTVVAFPGPVANIPAGWVLCDGTAYNGALPAYAALYAAIGVSNGGNVGAMEFNVPDYRGYFLRGLDPSGGVDPDVSARTASAVGGNTGSAVGSVEADTFVNHSHGVNDPGHAHGTANGGSGHFLMDGPQSGGFGAYAGGGAGYVLFGGTGAATTNISIDVAGGNETRPKNVAVNYIIKL